MKSTFSVIFYLKKNKVKKDGTSPIMGRITVDGTQAQFSCKVSIEAKLWGIKGGHQWVFGAEYLRRYHPYRESRIPVEQFTGEVGFFCDVLSDVSKTFFLSAGVSALAGYEKVNGSKKLLFDGSTIRNKDGFVYGGAITLQAETYLTDRLVLLLYGRERCLWGGSTGHFHAQYGVGLKIMMD